MANHRKNTLQAMREEATGSLYNYADVIKELRALRGMTQAQLAEITGVTVGCISHFENCRRFPSNDTVKKLAVALQVPASSMILLATKPDGNPEHDHTDALLSGIQLQTRVALGMPVIFRM